MGDGGRIYLREMGDEDNFIEVQEGQITVRLNGRLRNFLRKAIIRVACRDVRQVSALMAGALVGLIGKLILSENVWFGAGLLLIGAFAFHVGMQWGRRLVIVVDNGDKHIVHEYTFFRSLNDLHHLLKKHKYI